MKKFKIVLTISILLSSALALSTNAGNNTSDEYEPLVNLVVDGFTSTWTAWDEYGSSPYLDADDGSYIQHPVAGADLMKEGWFTFQNTTSAGENLTVVIYVDFDAGDGNDNCNWYIDINGDDTAEFNGIFINPTTGIYNTGTITGLDNATEINNTRLMLEYDGTGTFSVMIVDYAYLYTNLPPLYPEWDINQDGIINYLDASSLVSHYGESGTPGWIPEDINDDGIVNYLDVSSLVSHYGESY